ncbi:LHFPL tetraspan subfamily member 6 protein-like [Saccostrea echinata]|uniref:LHFPL tetraspan subfamily member 6 protein-like n=1 Tax=Saccostrea echinata TaxID=191078 RepID=UPI002A841597|nr:LHFPL tetraspan subfamily member 6 protein-like [Saccostrea echinata]
MSNKIGDPNFSNTKKINKINFVTPFTKSYRLNQNWDLKNGYTVRPQESYLKKDNFLYIDEDVSDYDEETTKSTDDRTTDDLGTCITAIGIICVIFLPVCAILVAVGASTPYWYDTAGTHSIGLFQRCDHSTSTCEYIDTYLTTASSYMNFTWKLVTGLELSGACLLLLASLFSCCYLACKEIDYSKTSYGILISVVIMLGAGCAVSGTVLMTSYYITNLQTWTLDWSFYTAAVGSGISFLVFCLYILYVFLLTFAD